jgi:hypothetical protein
MSISYKTKIAAIGIVTLALAPQTFATKKAASEQSKKDVQAVSAKNANDKKDENKNELKINLTGSMLLSDPKGKGGVSLKAKFTHELFSGVHLQLRTDGNLPSALWNMYPQAEKRGSFTKTKEDGWPVDKENNIYVLDGAKETVVGLLYKKKGSSLEGGIDLGWVSNILGKYGLGGKLKLGYAGFKVVFGMQHNLRLSHEERVDTTVRYMSSEKKSEEKSEKKSEEKSEEKSEGDSSPTRKKEEEIDLVSKLLAPLQLKGLSCNLLLAYDKVFSIETMVIPGGKEIEISSPQNDFFGVHSILESVRIPALKIKFQGLPAGISEIAFSISNYLGFGVLGYEYFDQDKKKSTTSVTTTLAHGNYNFGYGRANKASVGVTINIDTASSLLSFLEEKGNIKTVKLGVKRLYKGKDAKGVEASINATWKKIGGAKIGGSFVVDTSKMKNGKGVLKNAFAVLNLTSNISYELDLLEALSAGKKTLATEKDAITLKELEEFEDDMDMDDDEMNLDLEEEVA